MRIIGIIGKSGAGKTKVAGFLAAALNDRGFSVTIDSFALPIKRLIRRDEGSIDKARDRRPMQHVGQALRERDANHFIHALMQRHGLDRDDSETHDVDFLVVPDVRHDNEAVFCRQRGILLLVEGCHAPLEGIVAEHQSESFASTVTRGDVDAVIPKQPNLTRLATAVEELVGTDASWICGGDQS